MKGMDIFCSSQAATAICLSTEKEASSSSSSALASPCSSSALLLGGNGGGRAIDRHNPIIRHSKRYISKPIVPCINISQPPINPQPTQKVILHNKNIKNTSKKVPSPKDNDDQPKIIIKTEKSTSNRDVKSNEEKIKTSSTQTATNVVRRSWSCTKPSEFISPANSTRYLLSNDKVLLNNLSDFEPALKIFPDEKAKEAVETANEACKTKPDSSSVSPEQVVVLRVSLHCRGCEKKMRKHISRMQGVTSFNIDFLAKKVTVTGNITPLEVLSNISKVKNAQLWSPTVQSSNVLAANVNLSKSELKNESKGAAIV